MKSIAAYYVFVAMTSADQEAQHRRAELAASLPPRPSLFARIRSLVTSPRSAQPATSAA